MSRQIACGDLHGCHRGLLQCLERSNFSEDDTLIFLGDVVDGWSETYECVETLLKIKNLIAIRGNHDDWFYEFIQFGRHPTKWTQGGISTAKSYLGKLDRPYSIIGTNKGYTVDLNPEDIPITHHKFFKNQLPYYINDNKFFIHGGFGRHRLIEEQDEYIFMWDRDLWLSALSFKSMVKGKINEKSEFKNKNNFSEIFIGHTTTMNWGTDKPMNAANIWNLDTGAGFNGRVTFMDVDTKEYWQSDLVKELYPNEQGR